MVHSTTAPSTYFPLFLCLCRKRCVVVGGGTVALRKVKMILQCGARVTVVSPFLHPGLAKLRARNAIEVRQRTYRPADLRGAVVVIAATDNREANHRVASGAKRAGALVNVVDDPVCSDFIVPSFFRRGRLTVAVSTSGMSPAFARGIRASLQKKVGKEYGLLLSLVAEVRSNLMRQGISPPGKAWQAALEIDSLLRMLREGGRSRAKALLMRKLMGHEPDRV